MSDEEWRPVVGYEGAYEVSDLGRVRSRDRRVPSGGGRERIARGRMLSIADGRPYGKVNLKVGDGGRMWNVHTLVARAFLGPAPTGMEVCHNNGQHRDNRLSNLRYDTHAENQRDTVRLGGHAGANQTRCKHGHEFDAIWGGRRRCRTCDHLKKQRVAA